MLKDGDNPKDPFELAKLGQAFVGTADIRRAFELQTDIIQLLASHIDYNTMTVDEFLQLATKQVELLTIAKRFQSKP